MAGIPQVITEDRASGAQFIDGSLKFDSSKSQHLTRTPSSSSSDRKTWTWSAWVKRGHIPGSNVSQALFGSCQDSSNRDVIRINGEAQDKFSVQTGDGGDYDSTTTDAVLRDISWYHIVVRADISDGTQSERIKIYVNGELQSSTTAQANRDTTINQNVIQLIGARSTDGSTGAAHWDGYMSQVYMIDGLSLGPGYFGFTDPLTGTWRPKKFRAEGTTVNDGTVWSAGAGSNFESGNPATNGFNGNSSSYTRTDNANVTATVTFSKPIHFTTLEVRGARDSGNGTITVNGVDVSSQFTSSSSTLETVSIKGVTSPLTSISLTGISGSAQPRFSAIYVDGVAMQDSTTTNLDFGTNGFYLPMDGNSPIGHDLSRPNPINNGTVWSTYLSGGGGFQASYPATNAFNGVTTGANTSRSTNSQTTQTFTPPGGISYSSSVEVWTWMDGTVSLNGGSNITVSNDQSFRQIASGSGTINNISFTSASGNNVYIAGIRVDGVILVDNTYGNGWTPVNFDSSVALDKTTAALPILNTVSGGHVAIPGVRPDNNASSIILAVPLAGDYIDYVDKFDSSKTPLSFALNAQAAHTTSYSNFYGGSYTFDGNSDSVHVSSVPNNHALFLQNTSFTAECWVRIASGQTDDRYFMTLASGASANSDGSWYLRIYQSKFNGVIVNGNNQYQTISVNNYVSDKWTHIAYVREGNEQRLYIDGVLEATTTHSILPNVNNSSSFFIGSSYNFSNTINGQIQDVRIYDNVAKYTSNFTPASTDPDILPDTPSGVSGSSKLAKITDGAVAFDGSGDYLSFPTNSDFGLASGDDFTIECYTYAKAYTNSSSYSEIIRQGTGNAGSNGVYFNVNSSGTVEFRMSGTTKTTSGRVNIGGWNHIAVSRSSGTVYISINGRVENFGSVTNSSTTGNFRIGADFEANNFYEGQLSNVRFVKGTALYTTDFTPPTEPLTAITNTKLLCCQSNTSAESAAVGQKAVLLNAPLSSTPFADSSPTSATITNNGSITAVSAGTNSFNITNAASQNGSSQWFTTNNTNISFQGSWTVDIYFKLDSSASGYNALINSGYGTQTSHYMYIGLDDDEKPYIETSSSGSRTTASDALSKNVWYHGRVTQDGSTMTFYVNGTSVITKTAQTTDLSSAGTFTIGSLNNEGAGANSFHGLIGPVRILATNIGAPSAGGDATSSGTLSNSFGDVVSVNGNAAATNFNPFNTDINTVRGQETGYATLNPVYPTENTLSDGNLKVTRTSGSNYAFLATIGVTSGKWYWEVQTSKVGYTYIGIAEATHSPNTYIGAGSEPSTGLELNASGNCAVYQGSIGSGGSAVSNFYAEGDVLGLALDLDSSTKTLKFYKADGTLANTHTISSTNALFPAGGIYNSSVSNEYHIYNFGQKPFKFPPPDGFQPLNHTTIRPETVIARPDQFVKATLYSGNSAAKSINVGHKPDFVWIKLRNKVSSSSWTHNLYDSVREFGPDKSLRTDTNDAQGNLADDYGYVDSATSNGFTVAKTGTGSYDWSLVNASGGNYVAWSWKAGGNKNTFNIDDVGYANASDVNMNVGGLNSSTYNETQTWSDNLSSTTGFRGSEPATNAFDGNTSTVCSAVGSGTITFTSPVTFSSDSTIRVFVHGGNTTVSVNGGSDQTVSAGSFQTVNFTNSGAGTFTIAFTRGGGSDTGVRAIEIGGLILVDDTATPATVPSTAASGCSVGTKQGFSIVKWNFSSSINRTIAHGLLSTPEFYLIKNIDAGAQWYAYTTGLDGTLDFGDFTNSAFSDSSRNMPTPTHINFEGSAGDYIMYAWHSVPGLQKFGSYLGTNNADGPYVELGFKPAIVWAKRAVGGAGDWIIKDSTRYPANDDNDGNTLVINVNKAEDDYYSGGQVQMDILSNGFKLRHAGGPLNDSSSTYIYCAWAEAPTVNFYGAQSNAR